MEFKVEIEFDDKKVFKRKIVAADMQEAKKAARLLATSEGHHAGVLHETIELLPMLPLAERLEVACAVADKVLELTHKVFPQPDPTQHRPADVSISRMLGHHFK